MPEPIEAQQTMLAAAERGPHTHTHTHTYKILNYLKNLIIFI